jgi:hypothetical protein
LSIQRLHSVFEHYPYRLNQEATQRTGLGVHDSRPSVDGKMQTRRDGEHEEDINIALEE